MEIYIAIWLILLIQFKKKKVGTLYPIIWLTLSLLAGGRGQNVGIDTQTYIDSFNTIGGGSYQAWIEPSWNIICYVFYNFVSTNSTFFLTAIALMTFLGFFYVSYKESPFPIMSIFIFVSLHMYTASFNITRQYLAMSFVILAYYYYGVGKRRWSYLNMVVAISFHFSSIFALLFYLWDRVTLSSSKIYKFLIISILFGSLMNEKVLSVFTSFLFEKFLEDDTVFRDNSFVVYLLVFVQNIMVLFILKTIKIELYRNYWFKIFIFSCIVFNATFMISYAARFYSIFAISQVVFFPLYLNNVKSTAKFGANVMVLAYMTAQFFRILLANGNGIIPYESVFI